MDRYIKKPDDTELPKMLILNGDDEIMKHWQHGTNALVIDRKQISSKISESPWPNDIPVAFRSMTKRKEIWKCWETGRPFYYIDNGYMGNLMKKKKYYRVVKNNIQHTKIKPNMPADRYRELCQFAPYMNYYGKKAVQDGAILLVTPSEKPCQFYNIDKNTWLKETKTELRKYTDRPIIIREKGLRPDRIKDNSVAAQCAREQIHSVVTYQSMAALEAMHYGIPAFTTALSCVDSVVNRNLADIENPSYPAEDEFLNLLHYLAYCQYTLDEINRGDALSMIERMKLYD
tara:strand:+ start:1023 stop:1886 length:864 start_codon:yes stop_codon:yes gene_type:complete